MNRVRVRVQQIRISPTRFWAENGWVPNSTFVDATLNGDGTWTVPGVDLDAAGVYRIRVIPTDNAGNTANVLDNPNTDFSVN